jgi:hypothetical protein
MAYYYQKLFKREFTPQPFSYVASRPDHAPEGVIEILENDSVPFYTSVRHIADGMPMTFPLDAATNVTFKGSHYLHAALTQSFQSSSSNYSLCARARQFSCFIILIGRITSATTFEPSAGLLVQNKDDFKIPLMLERLPSPKEFADAIKSLSPEQQKFAKQFRNMQLESSLFGLCIIQIKPQLERLLNLPNGSLTKELKLTQGYVIYIHISFLFSCIIIIIQRQYI